MAIAFLLMAIVSISLQLYGCKKKIMTLRRITKPFIVPSMTLLLLSMLGWTTQPQSDLYPLIAAMVLYTLGDVLLLMKNAKIFLLGMITFAFGHVVIAYMAVGYGISLVSLIVSSLLWFTCLSFGFFPRLDRDNHMTPYLKAYSVVVTLYGIVVSASSFGGNIPARIIAIIGVAMFAISDGMIAFRVTDGKERSTRVMTTYVIAVALLLVSFYLMHS